MSKSSFDEINRIEFLSFLSAFGVNKGTDYDLSGDLIKMKHGGKITDGWRGSVSGGFLKCHSGLKPGRFEGDRVSIVETKYGITKGEAVTMIEEKFGIKNEGGKTKRNDGIKEKWNGLGEITDAQKYYLNERGIYSYDYVKNFEGRIALPIKSENGTIKAFQGRSIRSDDNIRYKIEKGETGGAGIFLGDLNKKEKILYVVEGMTDFLTVSQFTGNVIGLVSALSSVEILKFYEKKYNIIYIPDNDDAGKKSVQKLRELEIKFGYYSLENFGDDVKDVNDAWKMAKEMGVSGIEFLETIYTDSEKPKRNIDLALEKAIRNRNMNGWKIGDKVFDNATGGIIPGSVTVVNGLSGEGKTTTVDWIMNELARQNVKIGFCSLETDTGRMLAQFLGRHFKKNWIKEIYPNIESYLENYGIDKFDNILLYDDVTTIEDFEGVINNEGVDVLFIDYYQIIDGLPGKDMKDKMANAGRMLQRLAIETHTAIIVLSQVSKGEDQRPVLYRTPMESQMIKASADTFINVGVYQGKHYMGFVKNKYGDDRYKMKECQTEWNRDNGKISIWDDAFVGSDDDGTDWGGL